MKSCEAVERGLSGDRGAVADSRKNLIGKGCGLLSDRTGELLTQTLSSDTAVSLSTGWRSEYVEQKTPCSEILFLPAAGEGKMG